MRKKRTQSKPFSLFAFQDIITSVTGILILITVMLALELVNNMENSPKNRTVELNTTLKKQIEDVRVSKSELQRQLEQQTRIVTPNAFLDPNRLEKIIEDVQRQKHHVDDQSTSLEVGLTKAEKLNRRIKKINRIRSGEGKELESLQRQLKNVKKKIAEMKNSNRLIYNPISKRKLAKTQWLIELTGSKIRIAQLGVSSPPVSLGDETDLERWLSGHQPKDHYFMVLLRPGSTSSYRQILGLLEQEGFQYGYDLIGKGIQVIDDRKGAAF